MFNMTSREGVILGEIGGLLVLVVLVILVVHDRIVDAETPLLLVLPHSATPPTDPLGLMESPPGL